MNTNNYAFITTWAKKIKAVSHLGGQCKMCGETDIFSLQFHHVIPDDKTFTYGEIRDARWSKILDEINKCELLCCNCHLELESIKQSRFESLKEKLLEYKNQFCCENCKYRGKNLNSLQFHHKNKESKKFQVMRELHYRNEILPHILLEIDACSILCGNCHTKIHTNIEKFERLQKAILDKVSSYNEPIIVDANKVKLLLQQGVKKSLIAKMMGCAKSTITYISQKNS